MRMRRSAGLPLATLFLLLSAPTSASQDSPPPEFHETPFAVSVNRVTQADIMEYVRDLSKKLDVGTTALDAFDRAEAGKFKSELQRPVAGSLYFLQKAMMPSVEVVEFIEVKNEQEFEKLVRRLSRDTFGESGKFEGTDGKLKVSSAITNRTVIEDVKPKSHPAGGVADTNDQDAKEKMEGKPTTAISISFGASGRGLGVDVRSLESDESQIVEEDGIKYREVTSVLEKYHRFHGNLSYSGNHETVWDMALPSRDAVLKDASRDVDMGAEVYLERIPSGLKTLGWSMLYSGLSTEMQQRDGESDIDYNFRSSGGQLTLAIAKAGIFDSDHVNTMLQFASEEKPIRGHLNIDARKGSELSKRLAELSSAESRFAAIINDDAAVTMHFSTTLPEESTRVFKTGAEYLKEKLIASAGTDVDLVIGGAEIAETLVQIADQTHLEAFAKLGWTQASGGVIYGGLRVDDNPELLQSVLTLLTSDAGSQDLLDRFDLTKRGDLGVIEFLIPGEEFDDASPIKLTHLYIAHANSCLWICAGAENSYQILQQSIARCSASGMRTSTRVFSAEIDLEKWLAFPQDDPTGLTSIPQYLDAGMVQNLGTAMSVSVADGNIMQRVINLGGRQNLIIHLDSGRNGLSLKTEVGKAFGNYMVARLMQLSDGFVQKQASQNAADGADGEQAPAVTK